MLTFGRSLLKLYAPSSVFFVLVVIAAVATSDDHAIESDGFKSANEQFILVEGGFEYQKQPDLPYPTCKLKKGLEIDGLSGALQLAASDNSLSDAGE